MSTATNDDRTTVRIVIDGDWTASEMADFLAICNSIYVIEDVGWLGLPNEYERARSWERHTQSLLPFEEITRWYRPPYFYSSKQVFLRLSAIQYGSPGWIVLFGSLGGIGVLATFLLKAIEYRNNRPMRASELENKLLENEGLRIRNNKALLELRSMEREQRARIILDYLKTVEASDEAIQQLYPEYDRAIIYFDELAARAQLISVEQRQERKG